MTENLKYILKRIDLIYLDSNEEFLKEGYYTCPKDMALPCNCIPGIIVNISAYLTNLFLQEGLYEATLEVSGSIGYIRCYEGTRKLFPIEDQEKSDVDDTGNSVYALGDLICVKSEGEHAYSPFSSYLERDEIESYVNQRQEYLSRSKYPSELFRLELSIRLLSAMRARPLCKSSKAFLFAIAYLCPRHTFHLMYDAREQISKEWLIEFMSEYLKFLGDIEDQTPFGFKQRFNTSFQKAVGIDISAFLEDFPPTDKQYTEVLTMSYRNNLSDLSRKRAYIRRICEYLSNDKISESVGSLLAHPIDDVLVKS